MQYRARILDHSRLGKCFRRCHRSYKCHPLWHLAAHVRRRMSEGIDPGRHKTGDLRFVCINLHQWELLINVHTVRVPNETHLSTR